MKKYPVTFTLIGICAAVALLSDFGSNWQITSMLLISNHPTELVEIKNGEYWRILTPAIVHFNLYHLVFNLLWVGVLGSAIERNSGKLHLLLIFTVVAAASNYFQFSTSGPLFGGISGVVYAVFGYVWMQARYNRWVYGDVISPALVWAMMIWYVICIVFLYSFVANAAHTIGLLIGLFWGRIDAYMRKRERISQVNNRNWDP